MNPVERFTALLRGPEPMLAMAPMQDVTVLPVWRLVAERGNADFYVTEYFRVHADYHPRRELLRLITENPTGRPILAQMIGNDIPALVRVARELQQYPVAAIDLNLGCPAPVVYKKCAGGGLLREPARIDAILGALRDAVTIPFTVKTRVGFDDPAVFDTLLPIFAKHRPDLVAVHGRTVKQMMRTEVSYDLIARAARELACPVLANGNVDSAEKAAWVERETGARGVMIGRGAIRNPWIFRQIREHRRGEPIFQPSGREVLAYVRELYDALSSPDFAEPLQVSRMKKFLNYIGEGVEPTGRFLHDIRRARTKADFFGVCEEHLSHDQPMALAPYPSAVKSSEPEPDACAI